MQKVILNLIAALMIMGCSSETENSKTKQETESNEIVKMKANAETAEGMLMIQHMVNSFNEMQEENKNYAVLLGELSYQCDYIIKNCNMKGPDHDSLHTLLEPILGSIQQAKNAESNEAIEIELKSIVKNTELFFERFETNIEDV